MSFTWFPWSMYPVAVQLAWSDAGQIPMPAEASYLWKVDMCLTAVIVKETQFDSVGLFGENREIDAISLCSSSQWIGVTGACLHRTSFRGPPRCRAALGSSCAWSLLYRWLAGSLLQLRQLSFSPDGFSLQPVIQVSSIRPTIILPEPVSDQPYFFFMMHHNLLAE